MSCWYFRLCRPDAYHSLLALGAQHDGCSKAGCDKRSDANVSFSDVKSRRVKEQRGGAHRRGPGLPARLNPDWCRFLTGCLVGEVRAEAEGVPPRDRENSDTGPSYIPLGTALRTASYGTRRSRDGGDEKENITVFSSSDASMVP